MHQEQSGFGDNAVATLQANASIPEGIGIEGFYKVECRDAQGNLKWDEAFPNLVVAVDVVTFDGVRPDELDAANTAVPRTAEPPTV